MARAAILFGVTVTLWLTEVMPPFAASLALIAATPLVLGPLVPDFGIGAVLRITADPVMALFFGGFCLAAAASRHGIDEYLAEWTLTLSQHRRRRLLALVMAFTAFLSMWMSNVAAAAMMLAALTPHLDRGDRTEPFRRALLLGVAVAANLGGMATPLGTGPNGIAIAELAPRVRITFLHWMAFGLPLTVAMVTIGYLLIGRLHGVEGRFEPFHVKSRHLTRSGRWTAVLFSLAVVAWLTEPLHGIPAPLVSLVMAAALFGSGLLGPRDLGRIDWPTLILIAGGLVLGQIVVKSGILETASAGIALHSLPDAARVLALVTIAALLSAVMSNTASAAILIPLGVGLGLPVSVPVLVAIGTAFGMPFAVSTPPNAMVYGRGGLTAWHLLHVGLPLMILGCLVVGLTGPAVLAWLGLR